jgi:lactate dehydrogenase-like 2-hydroxyacid dehydrogenase
MNGPRHKVLIARRVPPNVAARAQAQFDTILAERDLDAEELIAAAAEFGIEGALICHKAHIGADEAARLPDSLKIIANPSAGYEHMDVAACKARGIVVTNAPDVLSDCTADLAMLHILAASRRAHEYEAIMRAGWRQAFGMPDMLGRKASGKTLGIVGMGSIGRALAKRARAFDMKILYHNRSRLAPELEGDAIWFENLDEMLPHSEILSLHLPGGTSPGPVMTRERIALLPQGAVLVNTARGSVVDEDALIDALRSGALFAAGLDVFHNEPAFDMRFADLPNTFLTPHVASATVETRDRMGFLALDNIAAVLGGDPPITPV